MPHFQTDITNKLKNRTGAIIHDWVLSDDAAFSGRFPHIRSPGRPANVGTDWVEYLLPGGRPLADAHPPDASARREQEGTAELGPLEIRRGLDLSREEPTNNELFADIPATSRQNVTDSMGVKYMQLALCFSDRLIQPAIFIYNKHYPDDRVVMKNIQDAYWETRGWWKRWFSTRKIWPWKVLRRIGYTQVCPYSVQTDIEQMRVFNDQVRDYTQCDRLEDTFENEVANSRYVPTNSQWRNHFEHPELCKERETWLRDSVPMNDLPVVGGYRGRNVRVLYFEHSLAAGVLLPLIVVFATCFSLCWAIKMDDISGGFGVGAYVLAFFAFVVTFCLRGGL